MTKKSFAPAAVALSTIAVTLLAGCASIQDQIAKQVAQGVVNQATGGKVTMNDQNGNLTIKDNQGNVANIGGGAQRPASVPADMPTLPGAKDYGWFGSATGGILTFTVDGGDYQTACTQMAAGLQGVGWALNANGFNMEVGGSKSTVYQKTGYDLTLTCAASSDAKTTTVSMSKTPSENTAGSSQASY